LKSLNEDKIIESKIVYTDGNESKRLVSRLFHKAYVSYGPVKHKYHYSGFAEPIYNMIVFLFMPYPNGQMNLYCIYEIQNAYTYPKFKNSISNESIGTLKYIQHIGEFDYEIKCEPNENRCEIEFKYFKDWLKLDYNQIIWQSYNHIVGEYSLGYDSYFFKLPIVGMINHSSVAKHLIQKGQLRTSGYIPNTYNATIKKGVLFVECTYYYYHGDNPRDGKVYYEITLNRLFEINEQNLR